MSICFSIVSLSRAFGRFSWIRVLRAKLIPSIPAWDWMMDRPLTRNGLVSAVC